MTTGAVHTICKAGVFATAALFSVMSNAATLSFFDNNETNPALNPDVASVAAGDTFTAQVFGNEFPAAPADELESLAFSVSWDSSALTLDSFDTTPWLDFSSGTSAGMSTITFTANLGVGFGLTPPTFGPEFTAVTLNFSVNSGASAGNYLLDITQTASQQAQTYAGLFVPVSATLVDGNVNISASAVPLPAAAWLFGSAVFGLGIFRRRAAV